MGGNVVTNMLMASSSYTTNAVSSGGTLAIGTSGTTTAKDHGKHNFNFAPNQQQRTNSLERSISNAGGGKQESKGNLLMQSSGTGSGGVMVGQASNANTGDRIGRYNDLRASLRLQQQKSSGNHQKSLTIGGGVTASRDGINKRTRTRSKGQSVNNSFVMASSNQH